MFKITLPEGPRVGKRVVGELGAREGGVTPSSRGPVRGCETGCAEGADFLGR